MNQAIYFKALQNKNYYRNSDSIETLLEKALVSFSSLELEKAARYIESLESKKINYTYPGHENYPQAFHFMKEPPLFLEFVGNPCWNEFSFLTVVGSREKHMLTHEWMELELSKALADLNIGVVSGGAVGVDQWAHLTCVKHHKPTVVVLPSGLDSIYPESLKSLRAGILESGGALLTEFSQGHRIHKSNFYFRNRLIVALGKVCLVVQAKEKSGTFLSVHHALENGVPVVTIPAHPYLPEFSGNIKLMNDGAPLITNSSDLIDFWLAESWSSSFVKTHTLSVVDI